MLLVETPNALAERKFFATTTEVLLLVPNNGPSRLREVLEQSRWRLSVATAFDDAVRMLCSETIPVLICETQLADHLWKELVQTINDLPVRPSVIVASHQADPGLWIEALSAGIYGLFTAPLDRADVFRTISLAWRDWYDRAERRQAFADRSRRPVTGIASFVSSRALSNPN
jgi:DNA-binding NtrC family response regulator